ncbi:DUF6271 family protein [Actinoplanes sp. NPDC051411]|uniref:DUF6271 family protein n=1 Tax=Actinoplanes sp. NPDC051411 TaxID=3155522 RepID=UPI00342EB42B
MRRVCLALPTHRECAGTIAAIHAEAAYGASTFGVEVEFLILDSCDPETYAAHAHAVRNLPQAGGVSVTHLDEAAQAEFLNRAIAGSGVAKPELIFELMLPNRASYGACTNRAFIIAAALGCESVHRRDSDVAFQEFEGEPVYPIHHELMSIGKTARDAVAGVTEVALDPKHLDKPVVTVGASFIGDLSVDIEEVREQNPQAYFDIVSLWAAPGTTEQEKRELVEESFTGSPDGEFTGDRSILSLVDPMRVDMSNISYYQVHEDVPLPPMTDTIGSDYFHIHLVPDSTLPGVLHNRHVINYHTPDRKADEAFYVYHLRLVKFFLSMLYLHEIYARMGAAGSHLLDGNHRIRVPMLADMVRASSTLDPTPNFAKMAQLERAYRSIGGRYAAFADRLAGRQEQLVVEARQDIEEFALLIEVWGPLVTAAKASGLS